MLQSKDTRLLDGSKKKQDPSLCCLQKTHFRPREIRRLKVKGWKNIYRANGSKKKKAGLATFILDKIDFKDRSKRQRKTIT